MVARALQKYLRISSKKLVPIADLVKKKKVGEYLRPQGRFGHLNDDTIDEIQKNIDIEWSVLLRKESA